MILIFVFSSQNAAKSSKTSGAFVTLVVETVYPKYETLSSQKQDSIISIVTFLVRKAAHFIEYFILGVLSWLNVITFDKIKIWFCAVISFAFGVLYSICDEIHQYFVPGRACRILDVLIDGTGVLLAVILLTLIVCKSSKIRSKLREINA